MPPALSTCRQFVLPDLGEGLTEAEVVAWHVTVGDQVTLNQVLVEVETEKAVVELPSPYAGTVVELLAVTGGTVRVGAALIVIDSAPSEAGANGPDTTSPTEENVPMLVGYGPSETPPSRRRRHGGGHREQAVKAEPATRPPPVPRPPTRPLAAPPVRFMARQNGIDLEDVAGHGSGGIITREDLAAHLAGGATHDRSNHSDRETRAPVRGVQKHMAEAMVRSVATAPQACVFLTVDATPTVELMERLRDNRHFEGLHVTALAVIARALVLALPRHPALNSSWDEATDDVVTKRYVNLGIAVAGPRGLIVPSIKDAQGLSLRELTAALADLTGRARAAHCTPDDLKGGTITLTNIGVFGVDAGVPILNPGEAAILAVGAMQHRPWEFEGELALRHLVTLSLAFDHRLVDGQDAALFLRDVGDVLADPANLIAFA
ncbi:MAG TPA: dihydrolipoamide acetyltransferase family protein [Acidimicrobiales bacterium]|nr:dihydrolipoamide acetyltransferase family protein [Acidimicrobiales bacterium]